MCNTTGTECPRPRPLSPHEVNPSFSFLTFSLFLLFILEKGSYAPTHLELWVIEKLSAGSFLEVFALWKLTLPLWDAQCQKSSGRCLVVVVVGVCCQEKADAPLMYLCNVKWPGKGGGHVSETTCEVCENMCTSIRHEVCVCVCECDYASLHPWAPRIRRKKRDEPYSLFPPQRQSHQKKDPKGKKPNTVGANGLLFSKASEKPLASSRVCLEFRNASTRSSLGSWMDTIRFPVWTATQHRASWRRGQRQWARAERAAPHSFTL